MKKIILTSFLIPYLLFSQTILTEEYNMKNQKIQLPGTLSYPKNNTKIPLALFIHGSGNVDRNGNQVGTYVQANYIKTLADSLNAKGIGFYRYDKRTATPANIPLMQNITINDFVSDAKIAVDAFKNDARFSSIHLIGHSQGSLIAMLAVNNDVASYTSIAGPSLTIDQVIEKQLNQVNAALGEAASKHFEELKKTDTILIIEPTVISLFAPKNQKFLKSWMVINPENEIQKLQLPILILQGDADLQVGVSDAENLKKAKPEATIKLIPKMNHMLKTVNSVQENQNAYADEKFPLSSMLIRELSTFILSHQN